jgi:organic hydroperoxide reductase OsmC/OhrA
LEGSVLKETLAGKCKGFQINLFVDSEESEDDLRKLIRIAHNSCFLENALVNPVNVELMNYINGNEVEV